MYTRIKNALCHPKYLGEYITDKTYKIVLLILAFLFIYLVSSFSLNYKNTYLNSSDAESIRVLLTEDSVLSFNKEDGTLNYSKGDYVYKDVLGTKINIIFDTNSKLEKYEANIFNFVISQDKVDYYLGNILRKSIYFKDFYSKSFSLDYTLNNVKENIYFESFIEQIFNMAYLHLSIFQTIFDFTELIFMGSLLFLLIFFLTAKLKNFVRGRHRIRLLLYSFISYIFLNWLALVLNNSLLYYLGLIFPYIYFVISLANIKAIVRKI